MIAIMVMLTTVPLVVCYFKLFGENASINSTIVPKKSWDELKEIPAHLWNAQDVEVWLQQHDVTRNNTALLKLCRDQQITGFVLQEFDVPCTFFATGDEYTKFCNLMTQVVAGTTYRTSNISSLTIFNSGNKAPNYVKCTGYDDLAKGIT